MHHGPEEWEALLVLTQSVYLFRYTLCGNVSVMFLGFCPVRAMYILQIP